MRPPQTLVVVGSAARPRRLGRRAGETPVSEESTLGATTLNLYCFIFIFFTRY